VSAGGTTLGAGGLGAAEAARRIAAGELTSEALVTACLERIEAREATVRAWAHLDPEAALACAHALDAAGEPHGPLHGVPVGVKDIIDTADLPTECGTPVHAGRRPDRDAECVARLRAAGAVVLGKTVTTELALYHPSRTRNPVDAARTPGGSSSGSAAAVADGMVPAALGSQTAGSVIRPAAFCGVLGFKPTHGRIPLGGVKGLSERLDTLGLFARRVEDLALLAGVLADDGDGEVAGGPFTFALCRTPWWDRADDDGRAALTSAAGRLEAAGAHVREVALPDSFAGIVEAQDTLQAHDCARSLAWELAEHGDALSEVLRAYLERGQGVAPDEASAAAALGASCRSELGSLLGEREVLLVPAVVGEPPPLSAGVTGDPLFCRPWTLLGVPALSVPGARGSKGLPVGVQLVAPAGEDARVLGAGAFAAEALATR
jgi:amidase